MWRKNFIYGITYSNNPMRFTDPTGYDGFDDVYLEPGMQAWVHPEPDGPGGGSGGGDITSTTHLLAEVNIKAFGPWWDNFWSNLYLSYNSKDWYRQNNDPYLIWGSNAGNNVGGMFGPMSVSGTRKYWQNMSMGGGGGNRSNIANTINNISSATSFTTNAVNYTLQYTKLGGDIGYSLSCSKAFLNSVKSLEPVGNVASTVTTGIAMYRIYSGDTQLINYIDATVGSVGLSAQIASYYSGIEIPYIGEFVAIYGTLRLFYDLGQTYGPSTWYGKNDYKWFE